MKMRPVRLALARAAVKRSGSASASASAKRWAKSLTSGHSAFGRQRHDDMDALAAGQHREGREAHVGEVALDVARRLLHLLEIEARRRDRDRRRCRSGFSTSATFDPQPWNSIVPIWTQASTPGRVLDIEIILVLPVLLADRDMVDVRAEAAGVMLLEEAFLGAALRAADQADRAVRRSMPSSARRPRGNNRRARPW